MNEAHTRIVKVNFSLNDQGFASVYAEILGYPTDIVQVAHDLCRFLFRRLGAWEFVNLQFSSPENMESENDWDWKLEVSASLKSALLLDRPYLEQ